MTLMPTERQNSIVNFSSGSTLRPAGIGSRASSAKKSFWASTTSNAVVRGSTVPTCMAFPPAAAREAGRSDFTRGMKSVVVTVVAGGGAGGRDHLHVQVMPLPAHVELSHCPVHGVARVVPEIVSFEIDPGHRWDPIFPQQLVWIAILRGDLPNLGVVEGEQMAVFDQHLLAAAQHVQGDGGEVEVDVEVAWAQLRLGRLHLGPARGHGAEADVDDPATRPLVDARDPAR